MLPAKIAIEITTKAALKQAYLPFVKAGGLLITLTEVLPLNTELALDLKLFNDEPCNLLSKVVWINPQKGQQTISVGVQMIGENAKLIQTKIENYLIDIF